MLLLNHTESSWCTLLFFYFPEASGLSGTWRHHNCMDSTTVQQTDWWGGGGGGWKSDSRRYLEKDSGETPRAASASLFIAGGCDDVKPGVIYTEPQVQICYRPSAADRKLSDSSWEKKNHRDIFSWIFGFWSNEWRWQTEEHFTIKESELSKEFVQDSEKKKLGVFLFYIKVAWVTILPKYYWFNGSVFHRVRHWIHYFFHCISAMDVDLTHELQQFTSFILGLEKVESFFMESVSQRARHRVCGFQIPFQSVDLIPFELWPESHRWCSPSEKIDSLVFFIKIHQTFPWWRNHHHHSYGKATGGATSAKYYRLHGVGVPQGSTLGPPLFFIVFHQFIRLIAGFEKVRGEGR